MTGAPIRHRLAQRLAELDKLGNRQFLRPRVAAETDLGEHLRNHGLAERWIGKTEEIAAQQLAAVGEGVPDDAQEELLIVLLPRRFGVRASR